MLARRTSPTAPEQTAGLAWWGTCFCDAAWLPLSLVCLRLPPAQYAISKEALDILSSATDARGRKLQVRAPSARAAVLAATML